MNLVWAVGLAGLTVARRAREAAERARSYPGEFRFGPAQGEPLVFSVFGDSVGCGFGTSAFGNTFAAFVAERLARGRPVLCRIAAVPGARAGTLDAQSVRGDERLAAVSIGTNDAIHGVPLPQLQRDLCAFLKKLSHAERVVVVGPGDLSAVSLLPQAVRPFVRRLMESYEDCLRRTAALFPNAAHVGFSNLRGALTPEDFAEDGFHPGDRGQRRIGELVYGRLEHPA